MTKHQKVNRRVLILLLTFLVSASTIYVGWQYIPEKYFIWILIVVAITASFLSEFVMKRQRPPVDDD